MQTPRARLAWQPLALVAVLVACRLVAMYVLPVYDDAFITFRYARNVASGLGFVYEPNELVLGTTAPLFGLLAAIPHIVGIPVQVAVPLFNIAIDAAILLLLFRAVRRDGDELAAVCVAILFAASPALARITVGGMEANLFVLATLVSLEWHARGRDRSAAVLGAVSYFLRPEGVLTVGLIGIGGVVRRRWRRVAETGALALATVLPGLVMMALVYGTIVPQSVIAKAETPPFPVADVLRGLVLPHSTSLALLLLATLGVPAALRRAGLPRLFLVWSALYLGAYLAARPQIWSWYSAPVQCALVLAGGYGAARMLRLARLSPRVVTPDRAAIAGALAAIGLWAAVLLSAGRSAVTSRIYDEMARSFEAGDSMRGTILADDIGAVGYFSNAYVYDIAGLVWPDALRQPSLVETITTFRPDHVLLSATRSNVAALAKDVVRRSYVPVRRFSPTGDSTMRLDPELYSVHWVQDYLLLRRIEPPVASSR